MVLVNLLEFAKEVGVAEVTWSGGPDLVVPLFIPPLIESEGGAPVSVRDRTANIGSVASGPSITRYFFSEDPVVDPATDVVLGERPVPALQPGEQSESIDLTFSVPSGLPEGLYHLAACADAPASIVELEEQNNCSFSQLRTSISVVLPIEPLPNNPPVCSNAFPSQDLLWPPNHKLAPITVQGITDPDDDPVSIVVTAITQDEPVNGVGDGDTSPDGFGVGTSQAQVRKERAGNGNGRVYAISFTGDDGNGGTCNGTVSVGVPHDQGKGAIPVDDGQGYDSTQP